MRCLVKSIRTEAVRQREPTGPLGRSSARPSLLGAPASSASRDGIHIPETIAKHTFQHSFKEANSLVLSLWSTLNFIKQQHFRSTRRISFSRHTLLSASHINRSDSDFFFFLLSSGFCCLVWGFGFFAVWLPFPLFSSNSHVLLLNTLVFLQEINLRSWPLGTLEIL